MIPISALEQAILNTVAYSDIFHYPLTAAEIHRYLIGIKASLEDVQQVLSNSQFLAQQLITWNSFYLLHGREEIIHTRLEREQAAASLWPAATHYGRMIRHMPYIRMVAVTGSLAMNNINPGADLDYLVVTRPGRLWLARGLVILLVRLAASRGYRVCPNYYITENALALHDQNIFTAHELAQMRPLSGFQVYRAMRLANPWVESYLPNAGGLPDSRVIEEPPYPVIQKAAEALFQNPAGDLLEQWEMRRKLLKFNSLVLAHSEAQFGPDCCKGHVDDHGGRVLKAYEVRLRGLERVSQ